MATACFYFAGVDGDSHEQWLKPAPIIGRERPMRADGRGRSVRRFLERSVDGISDSLEDHAMVARDDRLEDLVVTRKGAPGLRLVLLQPPGTTLDVAKQERDRPCRKPRHDRTTFGRPRRILTP